MRKYVPSFADLIDRLSIHQLKEVFIPEHKEKYHREMRWIMDDLDEIIKDQDVKLTGELIRAIIILAQMNEHIWYNESNVRSGESQDLNLLKLTHGLNGIRNRTMNYILDIIGDGDRRDWKTDCLAAEFSDWEVLFHLVDEQHDESAAG
jgi:hypothetical protein